MTDKPQKKKIYQIAKELNRSHDILIEYLQKRGYKGLSLMSVVTDEMMHDLNAHFKKDKEVAEKHQKKIQTIREQQKKEEEKKAESPVDKSKSTKAPKKKVEEKPKKEEVQEVIEVPVVQPVEIQSVTSSEESVISSPEQPPLVESVEISKEPELSVAQEVIPSDISVVSDEPFVQQIPEAVKSEVEKISSEEVPLQKTEKPAERKTKTPAVDEAREQAARKRRAAPDEILKIQAPRLRGLKIVDKVELKKPPKPAAKPSDAATKAKVTTSTTSSADADAKKKKKKKKRVVVEKVITDMADMDELLPKAKKKKKGKTSEVDQTEVQETIKKTLADIADGSVVLEKRAAFKKKRKEKREAEVLRQAEEKEKDKSILRLTEYVTVNELAAMMNTTASEVIVKCMGLGMMVSINHRLDKDTILLVSDEFGFQVQFINEMTEEIPDEPDTEEELQWRPPVVTIMGHVDHGKTSLLDYIRRTNIVAGESGGITQHIGAYSVMLDGDKRITFLDTPGHEAFTAMRARGAQITDIVVLVVAADDSVMPQTVEAISHAQAASVPIVVAINKCDKPEANIERIKQQLAERNVLIEEWGGRYQYVELSAKTGKNVDLLLEKILLEADVLNLRANPDRFARGVVIEARVDKGKGTVATVLVQKGTLNVGDAFVAGIQSGRVRAMFDERGNKIEAILPSTPVQVLGFDGVPQAGDTFVCMKEERDAREISLKRTQLKREQDFRLIRSLTLDNLSQKISEGKIKELKVVVKGDVDGSVGALADSLMKIAHEEVRVNVIHRAVGAISESDVLLSAASGAVIIGFHVRPTVNARKLAEQEQVDIRLYNIIYDAINDVKKALEGLLSPEKREEITATVTVQEVFKIPKVGNIAGCRVIDGKIVRNNRIRVVRDGIVIFEGTLSSLKRFKEDVREVETGYECGIGVENFNDLKPGDTIESFKIIESQRKLA
ncbi:MAG: translation initiation factor IF-2 [Ignavibacteriae bacterium]|nr:translation initiation factor IF-2 [Ignavibacteriota bacterium]